MSLSQKSFTLVLAICCLITTMSWGQSTPRSRYSSGLRGTTRTKPVRYQEDAAGPADTTDGFQGIGGNEPQDPNGIAPQSQAPDLGSAPQPAAEGSTEPDMIPTPKKSPSSKPPTRTPSAPQHRSHSQPSVESWEGEVDAFAGHGHDSWEGAEYDSYGGCDSCGDGSCGQGNCGGCCGGGCGWYARGEYLLMWAGGQDVPALVTTSPAGTARDQIGRVGLATTTTLFGDGSLNTDTRSGARAGIGFWLSESMAVEGEYLTLGDSNESFTLTSDATGIPAIARPFININGGADANVVAANINGATALTGFINVEAFSSFESSGVLMRYAAASLTEGYKHYELDYLAGYRYARLRDRLSITTRSRSVEVPSSVPVGTVFDVSDEFNTTNRFIGADFGVHMRVRNGYYTLDVTGRVAVGSVAREVNINGNTVTTVPGVAPATTQGGLLSQRTNIGGFRDDNFSVMPDVGIKLGMDLSPRIQLTAGYNFLALANVARAGEQIDTTVNITQAGNRPLTGAARPAALINDTGYWAHGVSFGLQGEF